MRMTAAEANRRQAEIWARYIQHENDLMRPVSGDQVCQNNYENVLAFCKAWGIETPEPIANASISR
jgi:hypothetical protein